jgi:hypothetical protein
VSVGLPIPLQVVIANFSDHEIKDLLVQLHIDDQPREQKLVSLAPRDETEVAFQFVLKGAGSHHGSVTLKKERLAGNPVSYFTLQAQDKLKVLIVDGDPQTSLVLSETFFLSRALNPAGDSDGSPFLPTVTIPDALGSVALDSYQAVVLCNVAAIPDALLPRLREYLRQGGGLLIFLGDRVQADDYGRKLFDSSPSILPARLRDKRMVAASGPEKIEKIDIKHPALAPFSDPILFESLKSTRVLGYFRTDAPGASALIALANGDPLALEKRVGAGRVILISTSADRDWSDLPLKTAYLPLTQSLVSYLQAEKKGSLDTGIAVGGTKKFLLPPSYVGKSLRITLPDRKEREISLAPETDNAAASFTENDLAGIYRVNAPPAADRQAGVTPIYPVNPPFLESRLASIGEPELVARFNPARAQIISIDSLEKGGSRRDLSLPLLLALIVTLLSEGWLAQRFYG